VKGLKARGDVTVDTEWVGGVPTRIALKPGNSGRLTVSSELFGSRFELVDQKSRKKVHFTRSGNEITIDAKKGRTYVATSSVSATIAVPAQVVDKTPFEATVTVAARGESIPAGTLSLEVPEGWTVEPATQASAPLQSGRTKTYTFSVTPAAGATDRASIKAVLAGKGWRTTGVAGVRIEPLPPCTPATGTVVAWDPASGSTVDDVSPNNRDATVDGAATYDAAAPTGSGLVLNGQTFLRTADTTLGYLKEATFATEVKVDGSGSYRRLFDFQPGGNAGTDGVLIDLTPSNQVRFIGAGTGVTTNAVVPTGRYLDLVIVMADSGEITVYIDGERAGGSQVPDGGIVGCATRQLRFAADQDGGQRLTGALDRTAILAEALSPEEIGDWRTRAFG
jgi:alpha-L-fucosidase 2